MGIAGWVLGAIAVVAVVAVVAALLELRFRRPDHLVLYESGGAVRRRMARLFPRHLSLSLPATVQSVGVAAKIETRGHLGVDVRLSLTVAPHVEHLAALVRAGGWHADAVRRAAGELDGAAQALVGGFVEARELEELSREALASALHEPLVIAARALGLELVGLTVQSVAARDPQIALAFRQREQARVFEQSQAADQAARVAVAKARVEADERIAEAEHSLEMQRLELRQREEEREATLARRRVEEDNARRLLQLEVDRKEIELLRASPELLVLTPQVARLAEASQTLRNARTVVSLAGGEAGEGSPILKALLALVERAGGGATPPTPRDV